MGVTLGAMTTADRLREVASRHRADKWGFDGTDFRRRARLRAALWREEHGWPMGVNVDDTPLGSRLAMPEAQAAGWNFLTPRIAELAAAYADGRLAEPRAKIDATRMHSDLLSSQPMCFNLFGELALDLKAATRFARRLWPGRVDRVVDVRFEHSPGRWSPAFLDNGSAFDVFLVHTTPAGGSGFVAIEVKYHENMRDKLPAQLRPRYRELALESGAFADPQASSLWSRGVWQLWLDHLLAWSLRRHPGSAYDTGISVLLHPAGNAEVAGVARAYSDHLVASERSGAVPFQRLTLEACVDALQNVLNADWVPRFRSRYLDFSPVDRAVAGA